MKKNGACCCFPATRPLNHAVSLPLARLATASHNEFSSKSRELSVAKYGGVYTNTKNRVNTSLVAGIIWLLQLHPSWRRVILLRRCLFLIDDSFISSQCLKELESSVFDCIFSGRPASFTLGLTVTLSQWQLSVDRQSLTDMTVTVLVSTVSDCHSS